MKILNVILFVSLSGCATHMLNAPGVSKSKYAPKNEQSRPGTIKYLNHGLDLVIASRREGAYKEMWASCKGNYKITSEGPRAEGGVAIPFGNSSFSSPTDYWYITFQCGEPDPLYVEAKEPTEDFK